MRYGLLAPAQSLPQIERAITIMPPQLMPAMMPHALETLRELKADGLQTGLISNAGFTTAPSLRLMLQDYGLLSHLDSLVFSDEEHLAKPDIRLFQVALSSLGLNPADAAFVGDNPHTDVRGAQGAGLHAVIIGARALPDVIPQARIASLPELIDLLAI